MAEVGLHYTELQFVWHEEIGDQTPAEIQKIKELIGRYKAQVSCIARHNFSGLLVAVAVAVANAMRIGSPTWVM